MKIGILTFHFAINYGALLQCYAFQEYLKGQGHEVKIINFIPPNYQRFSCWSKTGRRKFLLSGLKQLILELIPASTRRLMFGFNLELKHTYINWKYARLQKNIFKKFRNRYLNISEPYSIDSFSTITKKKYDAIIVGSDQVWNWSDHYHTTYFLAPLSNFDGKRISYATCCALNKVDVQHRKKLKESLLKFNKISVRNLETFSFVNNLTGKSPPIVVDPVLLHDFNVFLKKKPKNYNEYILTYIIGDEIEGGHEKTINEIKLNNNNLPVVSIMLAKNKSKPFSWSDKTLWSVTPKKWLDLFFNASFVYTDSFHGVLFAIKFKKSFLAYYKEKVRASRFIDLINRYELDKSIVSSFDDARSKKSFKELPNYEKLDIIVEKNIRFSINFLDEALKTDSVN